MSASSYTVCLFPADEVGPEVQNESSRAEVGLCFDHNCAPNTCVMLGHGRFQSILVEGRREGRKEGGREGGRWSGCVGVHMSPILKSELYVPLWTLSGWLSMTSRQWLPDKRRQHPLNCLSMDFVFCPLWLFALLKLLTPGVAFTF